MIIEKAAPDGAAFFLYQEFSLYSQFEQNCPPTKSKVFRQERVGIHIQIIRS